MKKIILVLLAALLASVLILCGCPKPEPSEAITLDYVSWNASNLFNTQEFGRMVVDQINEKSNGELVINYRGGPEVIGIPDIPVSVQKGTIDMAIIAAAYCEPLVPGADAVCKLSEYSSIEEREVGIYDYVVEMYKKAGLYYAGKSEATYPEYFVLQVDRNIEKPEDFNGLKLGGSIAFQGAYKLWGATPVTVALPEYYSALEQGICDGIATGVQPIVLNSLYSVAPYFVTHRFYNSTVVCIINLDSWNQIPDHLQDLITEVMINHETKYPDTLREYESGLMEQAQADGMKYVTFTPDMAEWFLDCAYDGAWAYAFETVPGNIITEIREKVTKH